MVHHVLVQDGTCTVPAEVIQVPWFRVSVFGGDRLTTNRVEVSVCQSGFLPGVTRRRPPQTFMANSCGRWRRNGNRRPLPPTRPRQTGRPWRRSGSDGNPGGTGGCRGQVGRRCRVGGSRAGRTAETAAGRAQDAAARAEKRR